MAPPPPPPPSDAMPMMPADPHMVTPPPKHKTPYGYKRHGPSFSKTATSSPATSHASSCASPSQFLKTRSAGDVTSPRVRACRMDPYPRYSPRKRLSADFSDGTYSGESCAESPRSEKGGWRIHAAVQGPFLTGPLAEDFTARLEELRSPRGKKTDEPDFDSTGLLLFPVVPDFVAPATTPEVFQASIQPAPAVQPQPEPDHSAVAQQTDASYYPQNTDQYYADATWDAAAQQQQEQYYYGEQQQYSAEQQYYYNNGYDQQQYDQAAYSNGEYNYQQSYEQYPAAVTEQPAVQASEYFDVMSPQNAEAFPPLPSQNAATPEVETPQEIIKEEPAEPVRRPRAPSYAEIVSGAAHAAPAVTEPEAPKPAAKATFASFDQLSDGIAESMSRILAKSNGNRTHAEVEFACLVRRIQTQLKLMGRVSNSLHLKQMKTMHKLQKSEIEKLSIESSNMELMARVKKYEQEQEELKKQLAVSLEAKDVRLRDAVDQLSAKIDSLKNSPLASEIDAIRKCSSPEDLEKRVEEIGQVIDYLVESKTSSKSSASSSKFEPRRQSVGSWKALALYALVVWAASLCGVWVGVKYAGTVTQSPVVPTPVAEQVVMHTPVVSVDDPVVELAPAFVEDVVVESTNSAEVMEEAVVEVEVPALMDFVEPVVEPLGVSDEVIIPTEIVAAEVTVESEVVSNPTEVVEEVVAPAETAVADAEPALVFTFEQLPRSSPSCFSCPSDHSTMASYFCDMLSEVMTANSMAADEPFVVEEEAQDVEATVVEPVVEFTAVSDNWNSAVLPAEETVETVEAVEDVVVTADEVVVSEELAVETVADVAVTPDVVESVPVYTSSRRSTTNVMSSPLTHALYVWCPSLFEMHTEEKDAAAGPLSDLARALTSLSSQILSEHTPSTIEEVIEELAVATFETAEEVIEELEVATVEEVIEEPEAATVATVEEVIEEPEAVNVATVEEVVEEHEVATFEVLDDVVEEPEVAAVEPEVTAVEAIEAVEQSVVEPVSEVEASAVVEVVEAETDVETEATTQAAEDVQVAVPSNRWATEQFLINVGVLSGTAEIVDPEEAVIVEETDSIVEDVSPALEVTEVVEEVLETPADAVVEEVLPAVDFADVNLGPTVETVADEVAAPVTAEAVEDISTCPLERCPLFEEVAVDEAKFTNASLVIAEPTFQIVEESVAADEEAEETVGTSPALDLKSLLLTSL